MPNFGPRQFDRRRQESGRRTRSTLRLDTNLSRAQVILDSSSALKESYGPVASPLIAYLGDSSLFVDGASSALLVIDLNGHIIRTTAAPVQDHLRYLASAYAATDVRGNLLYGITGISQTVTQASNGDYIASTQQLSDSIVVVRAHFDSRAVDSIARVKQLSGSRVVIKRGPSGKTSIGFVLNPLEQVDDWVETSDGSIAILRGFDYHIDWLRADGSLFKGPKLPTEWRHLSSADKAAIVDSARTEYAAAQRAAATSATGIAGLSAAAANAVRKYSPGFTAFLPRPNATAPGTEAPPSIDVDFVAADALPDYFPAFRAGAMHADLDGNVWILPTRSSESRAGELVYDVVNSQGVLTMRVRMPKGRSVLGFGSGRVIYLGFQDDNRGWHVEKRTLAS